MRFLLSLFTSASLISEAAISHTATDPVAETLYQPRPASMMPALAQTGTYSVGVTTLDIVNPQQFNPTTQQSQDRPLRLEVWYPVPKGNSGEAAVYSDVTRTGIPFAIAGDALRDATLRDSKNAAGYPLVVLSHGYTGYRTIMYYLGEHLASHGYVVAAIDHTDSTHAEVDIAKAPFAGFFSTLLNRSRDQQFVLNYFKQKNSALQRQVNSEQAAVIGFSMGGFGAINTIGGCYNFTPATVQAFTGNTDAAAEAQIQQLLNSCAGGQYGEVKVDPSWKAAIAIAPWGGQHKLFSETAMAKISVPTLYLAGDLDDISGYNGIKWLFDNTGSAAKYLLTFHQARHNIAPHPAPTAATSNELDLGTYHEGSWSLQNINEINKHFALAMLDCHVKAITAQCNYLDLPPTITAADYKDSGWQGFPARFSTGLSWQSK
jgi:predicted dienelactone hydrolase